MDPRLANGRGLFGGEEDELLVRAADGRRRDEYGDLLWELRESESMNIRGI